jgi:hypothetical protein
MITCPTSFLNRNIPTGQNNSVKEWLLLKPKPRGTYREVFGFFAILVELEQCEFASCESVGSSEARLEQCSIHNQAAEGSRAAPHQQTIGLEDERATNDWEILDVSTSNV